MCVLVLLTPVGTPVFLPQEQLLFKQVTRLECVMLEVLEFTEAN